MKRIAIIDDESHARQTIRTLLKELCPQATVVGDANGVQSGVRLIEQTSPQCVLLDISMEDGTGFDLLDQFAHPAFKVIFTTAFDQFALKAFRYSALDYLVKPIVPMELKTAIEKLETESIDQHVEKLKHLLATGRQPQMKKIVLSSQEGLVFLPLDQIVRLESEGCYTTFYLLESERHVVAKGLKEYEELLPSDTFFRIHQSHIVQRSFVRKVLKEDGGYVAMKDGSKIPLAIRRKQAFMDWVVGECD